MPLSAYIQSALFLIVAAVVLFASAGTFAIPAFWVYLAIMGAVFVASLTMLDPELLQERMHPGGQPRQSGSRFLRSCCSCISSSPALIADGYT